MTGPATPALSVVIPSYRMGASLRRCLRALAADPSCHIGAHDGAARDRAAPDDTAHGDTAHDDTAHDDAVRDHAVRDDAVRDDSAHGDAAHDDATHNGAAGGNTGDVAAVALEVIVVDSSSDGDAALLAREFPAVRVVALDVRTNAAAARNLGAQRATAPHLAFLDADCVPDPGWARALHVALSESDVVAGSMVPASPHTIAGLVLFFVEFAEFLPRRTSREVSFAPSCNLAMSRDAFDDVGGFPEELERSHDLGLAARLHQRGRAIRVTPAAIAAHVNRAGTAGVARHLFQLGVWSARARARFRSLRGAFLVDVPALALAVAPVRALRVVERTALSRYPWMLAFAVALWPALVVALFIWALGFIHGAKNP